MVNDFFFTTWLLTGMRWLYDNVTGGDIFFTILISTVIIRALQVFSDVKSRKSTMKMQSIQPEIDKLKKKFSDNPQKLQQAQSKLMKDRGVSMFGGCLPMLIMMPLFFAFIAAFRFWGYEQLAKVIVELDATGDSQLFESFKFLWVHNIWQPDSGLKPVIMSATDFFKIKDWDKLLYFQDNPAAKEVFERLGLFISDPNNIPQISIDNYNNLVAPILARYAGYANGWFVWPILAGGSMFLSSWVLQKGQAAATPEAAGAGANKAMLYMMPIMSVIFCFSANTSFAVYWTLSSLIGSLTGFLINKKLSKEFALPSTEVKNEKR